MFTYGTLQSINFIYKEGYIHGISTDERAVFNIAANKKFD